MRKILFFMFSGLGLVGPSLYALAITPNAPEVWSLHFTQAAPLPAPNKHDETWTKTRTAGSEIIFSDVTSGGDQGIVTLLNLGDSFRAGGVFKSGEQCEYRGQYTNSQQTAVSGFSYCRSDNTPPISFAFTGAISN